MDKLTKMTKNELIEIIQAYQEKLALKNECQELLRMDIR